MTNWLERAGREIQKPPRRPTANTDERTLTAVTAVPRLGESGNSRASNGSNGSIPTAGFPWTPKPPISAKPAHPCPPLPWAELPLEDAAYPWWRVSIVGPKALNIDLEMRSAWSVSDWGRFARRHYGPDATVVVRARPEPEPVTEEGASGASPEFASRLFAEDLNNIAAGDIPLGTVQALEQAAIAKEAEDLKEFFEERAGILEFDAGLPRPEAELEAARVTATLGRNRGYLRASLRAALADYPALLSQVPQDAGTVDALPLGTAKVAVLKGRRVIRQGEFIGRHEVKA